MVAATTGPRTIAGYINLCAESGLSTSPSGLRFANLSAGKTGFEITSVPNGDVAALTANILERYSDGIVLDENRQVSLICNWAHANDVDARTLMNSISLKVADLGDQASEYQQRIKANIDEALLKIDKH